MRNVIVRARFVVTAILASVVIRVGAQAVDNRPAFEVASIKPSGPDSAPLSIQRLPGRLVTSNTPLTMLVSWAFNLDDGRLFDAPRGADSARFDIVAQPPTEKLAPGELQLMMQRLLAERFKLAVHRETRELPAYELVVDDGGLKMAVSPPTGARPANPFTMSAAGTLAGSGVTTDMLATVLSNQLGRPVRNGAKVEGVFDFTLQWRPDGAADAISQDRPSLFTALREQLGLRLVSRRAPVEVIVIVRLELTPAEN